MQFNQLMKKFLTVSVCLFFIQIILSQTTDKHNFLSVEKHINAFIKNKQIPSVAVAVFKDGNIIYEKAFGFSDIENQIKATTSTSYALASVSKVFTASGIMILNKQNKIDIYEPAKNYMSSLKFTEIKGTSSKVRVADLMNHTSGLGTYFQLSYNDEEIESDSFEDAFKKYNNLFHPSGQIFEYSNLGYGLLDYIIEKQSGLTFSKFMHKELFEPLGFKNTFVEKANNFDNIIAKRYDSNLSLLPEIYTNTKGAGNIYASIHDLISFAGFHLNQYDTEVLESSTIKSMQGYFNENTLYHNYNSSYYGLGWYINPDDNGYKVVWHEGGMMGASSIIKLIPEENIAIAVLANTFNDAFCQDITNRLSKVVLTEYSPVALNAIADYKPFTNDSSYFGVWEGSIKVDDYDIPCSLNFKSDGTVVIDYLDYTYSSYFTKNNPIPNKTILLNAMINEGSFIGTYLGNLPSKDIRHEFSQIMSLKLFKKNNSLSGTVVALAAADREYYAYPYYIEMKKVD